MFRMRIHVGAGVLIAALLATAAHAQETDVTQTPNSAGAGIKKSLSEQIGAGRGDTETPDSSAFIIARDPLRAVMRGRQLFQRKFTFAQGVGPRTADGVGDIEQEGSLGAGLSDSCASCHGRPQGAAGFGGDVFTRPDSRDAPHLFGLGLVEMLGDEITSELRALRDQAVVDAAADGVDVTVELVSKGIRYGSLTALQGGGVDTSAVEGVDADLRVRPFFAEGTTISIREFAVGAFNAEMGLEAFDPDLAAAAGGARIVTPAGMVLDGSLDQIEGSPAAHVLDDVDMDGVTNEIPQSLVDFMEVYLLNYFKPGVRSAVPTNKKKQAKVSRGLKKFQKMGCATCHVPSLTIENDRRVADIETRYDIDRGNPFNNLYAIATPLFVETDDAMGLPTLKTPAGQPFVVEGVFADLKRHDLGPNFWERNFDGTIQKLFVTEPLWGVGSTAPYGHDGRSPTLDDVILRHGGEAQASRDAYARQSKRNRRAVLEFLETLVIFSPPATASNLDEKNVDAVNYPVNGHGSLDLSQLFNDTADKE